MTIPASPILVLFIDSGGKKEKKKSRDSKEMSQKKRKGSFWKAGTV